MKFTIYFRYVEVVKVVATQVVFRWLGNQAKKTFLDTKQDDETK